MSPTLIWLAIGAVFLAVEAFGVPGIGFLFAGLGAFVTGLMIATQLIPEGEIVWQIAAFFVNSSLLAALLWKNLRNWRTSRSAAPYSNMVGDEATVIGTLHKGVTGEVKWSGTRMRAKLAEAASADLPDGTIVIIQSVEGNVVTVAAK